VTTVYSKLVASEKDFGGYITYVFKNLEPSPKFGFSYIMVVRFRNWQHKDVEIGESGFLTYDSVIAGQDKWYNKETEEFIPYNYTNNIFIKFVEKKDNLKKDIII